MRRDTGESVSPFRGTFGGGGGFHEWVSGGQSNGGGRLYGKVFFYPDLISWKEGPGIKRKPFG